MKNKEAAYPIVQPTSSSLTAEGLTKRELFVLHIFCKLTSEKLIKPSDIEDLAGLAEIQADILLEGLND